MKDSSTKPGRMFLYFRPGDETPSCVAWDIGNSRIELREMIEQEHADLAVLTNEQAHEYYAKYGDLFQVPKEAVNIEPLVSARAYYPQH